MKRVIFTLSMPSNNAWNKKWSGEDNNYTVARRVSEKTFALLEPSYSYNFGDGWIARVSISEAKPRQKVSGKFCGYDWMIDSILYRGEIRP